jgi:hypothetical protein
MVLTSHVGRIIPMLMNVRPKIILVDLFKTRNSVGQKKDGKLELQ